MRHARLRTGWSIVAVLVLWGALVVPYQPGDLQPAALLRLPLEGLVLAGVLLVLPARARRPAATLAGAALALMCLLKVLELGFRLALGRPFDAATDTGYAGSAVSLLFDSAGTAGAVGALAAGGLAVVGILVVLPLAALRVADVAGAHRTAAAATVAALATVWAGLAVSGVSAGGGPIASAGDARLAVDQTHRITEGIQDERRFDRELAADPHDAAPAGTMLSGLRGKDVLVVFVESYGRFTLEGPSSSPVTSVLDQSTRRLRQAGFHARSAFLTSPTIGGTSWLVHSTLQSGLWIDSERRYDRLMASRHSTLTSLFGRAGWRTVMMIPSSERPWPDGKGLYRFDTLYGGGDLGYTGPRFGYAKVPDQYTLEALHRLELAPDRRRPVMAEVDLVSSHTPWTPLPRMVPWDELGNGEIYDGMPGDGEPRAQVWSDRDRLRSAYTTSVVYSLRSLVGFVLRHGDDDLVLVVLGDHQPNTFVTGQGVSHDVPVSVIARDPSVIGRIAGWGWQDGLRPGPDAPVWRMDAFRGRFLDAYSAPARGPLPVRPSGSGPTGRR
ncbi:MAG: CDP-alcohol phosphatidyltransferase [Actinomycetota bacterium]